MSRHATLGENPDFYNLFPPKIACPVSYPIPYSCLDDKMLNYKEHLSKSSHSRPDENSLGVVLHVGVAFFKQFIVAVKQDLVIHRSIKGLHCTWLVPCTRASSDGVDISDSGEWIHLKRGVAPWRVWPNWSTWTLHHALRWDSHLVESQEGLETKVGPRIDLVERLFGNRALVWCLAGIDYEMPELDSDDLILGSGLCPWSPTVALYVSLNSDVEVVLMCLDSLRLPSCTRNPHISSSISIVKIIKESVFLQLA
ncbi:hypothetical protein M9H77_06292 [Catharanthus roseus]|uniref:Uncharacterized protein n=1 Tax=Catharanthus roseus TaxID=4058 RepID=A0ACC0BS11_CATRO|nr:hypothetical protein M9H77_06292 [Catharanthus roseus]